MAVGWRPQLLTQDFYIGLLTTWQPASLRGVQKERDCTWPHCLFYDLVFSLILFVRNKLPSLAHIVKEGII